MLRKLSLGVWKLLLLGLIKRKSGSNPRAARILCKHWRLPWLRLLLELRLRPRTGIEPEVVLDISGLGGSESLKGGHCRHSGHVVRPSQSRPRAWSRSKPLRLRLLRLTRNKLELLL